MPSFNAISRRSTPESVLSRQNRRRHLQTDLSKLDVKMTFRGLRGGGGRGVYPCDVKGQKCMGKPTYLVKIVTLRRGEGGYSLTS